jgi:hypothetical protein
VTQLRRSRQTDHTHLVLDSQLAILACPPAWEKRTAQISKRTWMDEWLVSVFVLEYYHTVVC